MLLTGVLSLCFAAVYVVDPQTMLQPQPPALPKRTSSIVRGGGGGAPDGGAVAGTGVAAAKARAQKEREASQPQFKKGMALLEELPDMSISEHVKIKGDLKLI